MKNDLTCAVVGDLLPSYIDGLASEETGAAVRAHLSQCEHCRARYEAMKKATGDIAAEDAREVDYLKTVRRKRRKAVAIAVICTAAALLCALAAKTFVIGAPAQPGEFSYSVSTVENTLELKAWPAVYGHYRIALAQNNVRVEDGTAYITVRKIAAVQQAIDVTPEMVKTVTVDLTQVDTVYLCGALLWQDGLTIRQSTNQLYEFRVDYVGDNSAVSALWSQLDPGYGAYTISLQTEAAPYGFTVAFQQPLDSRQRATVHAHMVKAGESMLALVGNLGVVSWTYEDSDGEAHSESITLEEVNASLPGKVELYNQVYGTDWEALPSVKDYAASPATLQQLADLLGMPH